MMSKTGSSPCDCVELSFCGCLNADLTDGGNEADEHHESVREF